MILSILICTLPERQVRFFETVNRINSLIALLPEEDRAQIEILHDNRHRGIPTGTKRNELIMSAQGTHFIFLDDDDWVSDDYVNDIYQACKNGADVVTFNGWMTTNGLHPVDWIIKLGERYEARTDSDGITRYYRFPNHLCAFKKSLVGHIKFADIWQGEDYRWALNIHERGILKNEVHIEKKLYHYLYLTNK